MDILRIERNELQAFGDLYRAVPPAVRRALGVAAREEGTALAVRATALDVWIFNRILGLGVTAPVTESRLDTLLRLYPTGAICAAQIAPGAQAATLAAWLRARGFMTCDAPATLCRDAAPGAASDTGVRVAAIGPEHGAAFARITCAVFDDPPSVGEWLTSLVGRSGWRHYLAFADALPIAAALLFLGDGIGWLGWGSTLPAYRGRGAQHALYARRVADAHAAGCRLLTVDAVPGSPSYRNAVRVGFQPAYERLLLVRPATLSPD